VVDLALPLFPESGGKRPPLFPPYRRTPTSSVAVCLHFSPVPKMRLPIYAPEFFMTIYLSSLPAMATPAEISLAGLSDTLPPSSRSVFSCCFCARRPRNPQRVPGSLLWATAFFFVKRAFPRNLFFPSLIPPQSCAPAFVSSPL